MMKNRYGNTYWFESTGPNTYTIKGDLDHWRYGGKEGQDGVNELDLGFVDPSGGPFIAAGYVIEGRPVIKISARNNELYFEVE